MSKTPTERQRECRQRKRDNVTDENVTHVTIPGVTLPPYVTLDGERVYGQRAVHYRYSTDFDTRPEPLDVNDTPVPLNRGRYTWRDGTVYQFDTTGNSFECKHPFKDSEGNDHLATYETVADVRAATGAATRP